MIKMRSITKCLNEWNPIVEALGQGKQTILIRKYGTNINKFFLYPTISYTSKDDNYINSFKEEYKTFVEENAYSKKEGNKSKVKYFAKVIKVSEISPKRIGTLNKYHIWTNEHVKNYLNNNNAHIWLLRVFKINKPVLTERTRGMRDRKSVV